VLIGVIKFVPLPSVFAWQMLASAGLPGAGTISALVAIAFVLAGVFMFGTLKNRADESERLLKLAREEAEIERDRAERERDDKLTAEAEVKRLQALPNLEQHARLLQKLLDKADSQLVKTDEQTALLREIRIATVPPER